MLMCQVYSQISFTSAEDIQPSDLGIVVIYTERAKKYRVNVT